MGQATTKKKAAGEKAPARRRGGKPQAEEVDVPAEGSVAQTRTIDLDAARAARAEARGDAPVPTVRIGGVDYPMPAELPAGALTAFGQIYAAADSDEETVQIAALSGMEDALETILGAETWAAVKGLGLSFDDYEVLLEGAFEVYGVSLGE